MSIVDAAGDLRAFTLLGVGFALGLKHAFDADHLVAISTIVSERKGAWRSSLVGAVWGAGHTLSLLLVGLLIIVLGVQLSSTFGLWMELTVAVMLMGLGANVLWKIYRGATFHFHVHHHDTKVHIHPHLHEAGVDHKNALPTAQHHSTRIGKKPFVVGIVHGLAGSATLMLVVLTTVSSRALAVLYIAVFGFGSVGGMVLMSALIGLPFAFTAKHERLNTIVRAAAGIVSVVFGLVLAWQVGVVQRLFVL